MDKGPDNVTQTQTTEPPAYLAPFLGQGVRGAATLLGQGGPQQYPGAAVVPFSAPSETALGLQQQRALSGSPVTDAAQRSTFSTLRGDFLNPKANPFLQEAFNPVAANINRVFDETLARSGRDLTGNIGARASQVGNAANQFFNQNFQSERDRMLQAANQAIPLAREDYFDIGQLRNVGQQVEGLAGQVQQDAARRFQAEQQRPEQALNDFISRIMGQAMGSQGSSTQPVFRDPLSQGLGGALAGGQLASLLGLTGGAVGAGAGIGGLLGLLSDRRAKENIRRVGKTDAGLNIYTYNYIGNPLIQMGVMADEVKEQYPDAVYRGVDGLDRVIYGRIH